MRTLWIAGLGAVLVTGGVSAQTMNSGPQGTGTMNERALGTSANTSSPNNIRPAQDPRLEQSRLPTGQNMRQPAPIPEALRGSTAQQEPDRIRETQDPRLQQQRLPARQNVQSGGQGTSGAATPRRQGSGTAAGTHGRTDAPRNPADRAYMGGGMILENGRPVPLPGDPPGMASDFRGEGVPQSSATGGRRGAGAMGGTAVDGTRTPQTNVGQTGTRDQGMVGTPQGAFPANPPTPGGRIPSGN